VALKELVVPEQIKSEPEIAEGKAFTVTTALTTQLPIAYDIVAVPEATPETRPPKTVATAVLLLLHEPPPGLDTNEVVVPAQSVIVPVIAAGIVLTVIPFVAKQPVGNV
jgi:hypothetical protein